MAACKYPPRGIRGCGPRRPSIYDKQYIETADDEILVMVQIETVEAVQNVEAICAVEGVDGIFLGPMDLSFSMGYRGKMDSPDYQKAIDTVLAAAKAHNVIPGLWLGAGRSVAERISQGWKFIGLGLDIGFLMDGTMSAIKAARK